LGVSGKEGAEKGTREVVGVDGSVRSGERGKWEAGERAGRAGDWRREAGIVHRQGRACPKPGAAKHEHPAVRAARRCEAQVRSGWRRVTPAGGAHHRPSAAQWVEGEKIRCLRHELHGTSPGTSH
jgi:hypothetical protein